MKKTIDMTPNWEALFRYATQIVKSELPKDKGQEFVVEMLEYGARLENAMSEKERGVST